MRKGDRVWVTRLREEGTLISATRAGLCRVQIDRLVVECEMSDLATPPKGKKKKTQIAKPKVGDRRAESGRTLTVDLHGLIVVDALAAVTSIINQAALEGAERIEIVHGIGTGRVKRAVHQYLGTLPIVEAVKEDSLNPGVTWVYL
jgi:DNA mismatch repair protein MutS2